MTVLEASLLDTMRDLVAERLPDAARAIVDAAKAEAPRDSGATRDSIGWERDGRFGFVVFARTEAARIQDTGSRPHVIRPRTKQALFWEGALYPVAKVNHPGSRKHRGWWTDAPWDTRAEIGWRRAGFGG